MRTSGHHFLFPLSLLVGWLKNRMNKTHYISSYSNNTYIICVYINIYIHISVILPKVRTVNSHNFTRILLSIFLGSLYINMKSIENSNCLQLTHATHLQKAAAALFSREDFMCLASLSLHQRLSHHQRATRCPIVS